MVVVFAYVDIFGFYRADVLEAALAGRIATTSFTVNQLFLTSTLAYILAPVLMVVLSLVLRSRVNRVTNVVVSLLYAITVVVSCIGEEWVYYLLGSTIEVVLHIAILDRVAAVADGSICADSRVGAALHRYPPCDRHDSHMACTQHPHRDPSVRAGRSSSASFRRLSAARVLTPWRFLRWKATWSAVCRGQPLSSRRATSG
jgi:hypothetical protein